MNRIHLDGPELFAVFYAYAVQRIGSDAELALRLGVSRQYLSGVKNNLRGISVDRTMELVRAWNRISSVKLGIQWNDGWSLIEFEHVDVAPSSS